ncbi:hypothetical protein P168DRAFT_282858 [Aspergillus campestris IBT 28561]|uniref:Uncharacterized protein n=1 Tax=Aspergillus campestris (strain IBT 28561) TaxID=1392248 RepID=A0A2I1CZP5_ASPC2|nr:uncharacterized protein P168DRAFT_282858 [Aspergillus campestris IBT 28561]PKY03086.1 hypothetical protein P168DRAFT_282858 [Aspergillus campestris IBT 28561]
MQLTNILLAFMASAVVVMAAPAAEVNENNAAVWKCPTGWAVCGTCNGGDCKVAGTNRAQNKAALEMEQSAGALGFSTFKWIALAAVDEKSFLEIHCDFLL